MSLARAMIAILQTEHRLNGKETCRLLGISPTTKHYWERGLRHPDGPAQRLLELLEFIGPAGRERWIAATLGKPALPVGDETVAPTAG